MPKNVIVIGAGIVGLVAAKELAASGIDVTVYDAKKSVDEGAAKASGIFSTSGLKSIGIPYQGAIVNSLNGAVLHAGREKLKIKAGETKAFVVDRRKLAVLCKQEAERAGVNIKLGKRLGKSEITELAADKGNIIIGADGAVSTVASAFSFPHVKEYALTYKAEYSNAKIEDGNMVGLFFSNKIAYRFFGWTVPYSRERLEVGIGISDRAKLSSSAAFGRFLSSGYLDNVMEGAKRVNGYASLIPLSSRKLTVKDNVLLVGDAAGQVKATTGGGIIFGASCARILAGVVRNNIKHGTSLAVYERAWRRRYGFDLKIHTVLHGYYSSLGARGFEMLFKLSRILGAEQFFGKYGDMDRPSLMVKRFFLRGLAK